MRSSTLANRIAGLALTKKALDIVSIDLRGISSVADFFVVCSGDSDIQVKAIADAVEEGLDKDSVFPWHRETGSPHWIVIDYVDVVAHIFHKTTRSFYNLEKLWGDAKIARVEETPEPRRRAPGKAARRTRPSTRAGKGTKTSGVRRRSRSRTAR